MTKKEKLQAERDGIREQIKQLEDQLYLLEVQIAIIERKAAEKQKESKLKKATHTATLVESSQWYPTFKHVVYLRKTRQGWKDVLSGRLYPPSEDLTQSKVIIDPDTQHELQLVNIQEVVQREQGDEK